MNRTSKLVAAMLAAGALATMPSTVAAHDFQLKNCVNSQDKDAWEYLVFDGNDDIMLYPIMTINFGYFGQTKPGHCHGGGDGKCKLSNLQFQKTIFVHTTLTVYGDKYKITEYEGLLDCDMEPSASAPSTSKK